MQLEPPTLSLGVPTIWLGLIQAYEAAQAKQQPGRWTLPAGLRSMVGGAAVPESLIRAFARHGVTLGQGWGMTETSPLATVSYRRAETQDAGDDEHFRRAAMAGVPVPWSTYGCAPTAPAATRARRQHARRDPGPRAVHHGLVPRGAGERRQVHARRLAAHR